MNAGSTFFKGPARPRELELVLGSVITSKVPRLVELYRPGRQPLSLLASDSKRPATREDLLDVLRVDAWWDGWEEVHCGPEQGVNYRL